ncbi:hypothetical protein [Streptacidiphilus sp. P02-A3a]|uniref:hypothetical protein n=1 Tax=Streptacidiphilus sp. P02-A3a TaxID=2704468 RepID=UPI0015FAB119|nr:hypothetical protein [Streptacidiphilus sp. P02-A3a]QMU72110.1 hypothetical protein GXP74_31615 [Streptacidiphilus sp. P02-A3a]
MQQPHDDDIDWDEYLKGEPRQGIHWHAFHWKGPSGKLLLFKYQNERVPGTPEFQTSTTPPEALVHHLLKPQLVRATFTDVDAASAWMREQWEADPPQETYKNPDNCQKFARRMIELGKDTIWSWDWPRTGDNVSVRAYMITCPNPADLGIRCPAPPR